MIILQTQQNPTIVLQMAITTPLGHCSSQKTKENFSKFISISKNSITFAALFLKRKIG
jgi:hypothetical protein